MRVSTDQSVSLADDMVSIPPSELDVLSELIKWSSLEGHLKGIQSDYCVLSLFKILLLQTWHNLSDASISDALHRDLVFMHFCGFSLEGKKPDAATICRFRQKLIQKGCLDILLALVNDSLEKQGLKLSEGKYVSADATLIKSARRPRKHLSTEESEQGHYEVDGVEYSDDKDASWIKKGKDSTYGYSSTVMTDEEGMVLSVNTHPANESEMSRFSEDMDESVVKEGQKVLYDKGAASHSNREHLKEKGLRDGIMQKKPKGKAFTPRQKLRNQLISAKRFVTERTFGTLKRVYGLHRARYLGLAKVQGEVLLKSIAYNLKRAINKQLEKNRQQNLQEQCI